MTLLSFRSWADYITNTSGYDFRKAQPLLAWAMESGFATIEERFDEIIDNFPSRPAAWLMRLILQPLGRRRRGPSDALSVQCAELMMAPSELRDRLADGLFLGRGDDRVARLERAFELVIKADSVRQKMRHASVMDRQTACENGLISKAEAALMEAAEDAVREVIAVDDFPAAAFVRRGRGEED